VIQALPLHVRRYDLGSAPYQALLRDYLCGRLSLDRANAEDVALSDAIIRAADSRFAYVSFLADRREVGQASVKNISALATGSGLYRVWLANLEREYGRKQAEAIRQVLALLAAMEEAHAWVFGDGRKIDPATGGALTPLPEQFAGLEIGLLARLLDLDRPEAEAHDRVDPGLLLALQMLQGVLWVSRAGAGATRFRLALKEFLPAAKDDTVVGPMLKLMQARVAAHGLDAADQLTAGDDPSGAAWTLLEPLAPFIEALVHLSNSDPIAKRWNPAEFVSLLVQRDDALRDQGHALQRLSGLTLVAALALPPSRHPPEAIPIEQRTNLASSLQNRGTAKAHAGDLGGAIADYDAALGLMQAIRGELGEAWPIPMQNELAGLLQNRGTAKAHAGDLGGAIADFDSAIALREAIRAKLGEAWPIPMQNGLATSLQNRGIAKADSGDLQGAIADYDSAIAIRQAIRAALGESWPVPLQNDLAAVIQNRGIAKANSGDLVGAIADFDAGIALMQAVRAALGDSWPVPLQNDLAVGLLNGGNAKAQGGDQSGAIVDFDASIVLMQRIRAALGEDWPIPWQNGLAAVFQGRGNAKATGGGDFRGAIADFDAAIALRQAIRSALGEEWPIPIQNDLATSLQNRGKAKADSGDLAGAIADYNEAIALMQAIRAALGEAWPVPLQNDLANSLQNRGKAKAESNDLSGAIADYDAAIGLMEAIRAKLGEVWPIPMQNGLANSLQNRGNAKRLGGDLAGATADFNAAIALREAIRRRFW